MLANTVDPPTLPAWLSEADLDYYTQEFSRTGFRGGLNWYRNLRRNWELGGPWRGQPIRQPSLFIAGSRDGVLRFPAAQSQLDAYPEDPARPASAATSSKAPATGCSRSVLPRSTNC